MPRKIALANLPTRIDPYHGRLKKYSLPEGVRLWIKRDDQTGSDLSGNKVRKLEYSIAEAIDRGCDTLISTGGLQSNHCRATAAAAAKLGLGCHLMLRAEEPVLPEGNHFLDELYGATVHFITPDQYQNHLIETMQELASQLERQGAKPYWIPTGASNGIGTFGYFGAMEEILQQEKELGIVWDTVVCAVGSGGTYAGLVLANHLHRLGKQIVGFAVASNAEQFRAKVHAIADEFSGYIDREIRLDEDEICIFDETVGLGYAQSTEEEREFIRDFAEAEGIVVDPVYTGKALRGLMRELSSEQPRLQAKNVLFLHTGGLYGLLNGRFSRLFAEDRNK
ncbi:MAG: D-cysteine desulfhydrase family protein [Bacillota bacterium]|nr:D-cysteine desulfhydrase family protein [Bacillota bacterium]